MPKSKRLHMSCSYSDIAMAGHDSKALMLSRLKCGKDFWMIYLLFGHTILL